MWGKGWEKKGQRRRENQGERQIPHCSRQLRAAARTVPATTGDHHWCIGGYEDAITRKLLLSALRIVYPHTKGGKLEPSPANFELYNCCSSSDYSIVILLLVSSVQGLASCALHPQ